MKKMMISFFFFFFSSFAFANLFITPINQEKPDIRFSSNASNLESGATPLLTLPSSWTSSSSSSPLSIFVPIKASETADIVYSSLFESAYIPTVANSSDTTNFFLRLWLQIQAPADRPYVRAAVEKSGQYYPIRLSTSSDVHTVTANFTTNITLSLALETICEKADCSFLNQTVSGRESSLTLYLYLDSNTAFTGSTINPSSYAGGLYLKLYLSDKVYTQSLKISSLSPFGDKVMSLKLEDPSRLSSIIGTSFLSGLAFFSLAGSTLQEQGGFYKTLGATFLNFKDQVVTQGDTSLSGLQDKTQYNISVGVVTKYKTVTALSNSLLFASVPLDAVLKKKCFIVSAGFGDHHPLVHFFQRFRDQVLLHLPFGDALMESYYIYGSKLAPYVVNNVVLKKIAQIIIYSLYLLIQYFVFSILIFTLFLMMVFVFFKQKGKVYGRS